VVRRERGAHVDAEDGHLHADEREGHPERKEHEDGNDDDREAQEDERKLHPPTGDLLAGEHEVLEAEEVQVQTFEGQEREEQPALLARDQTHDTARLRRVLFEERDRVDFDVGVFADAVRVRVVAAVLGVPPGIAHPDDAGADDARQTVVCAAAGEDHPVRCLVRDERSLGEEDAEGCGDEQLEPAVAQQDEPGHAPGEAEDDRGAHQRVEPWGTTQQTHLLHDLRDLRVRAGHRREGFAGRVRLAHRAQRRRGRRECGHKWPLGRVERPGSHY
jgi:hypothetical protein